MDDKGKAAGKSGGKNSRKADDSSASGGSISINIKSGQKNRAGKSLPEEKNYTCELSFLPMFFATSFHTLEILNFIFEKVSLEYKHIWQEPMKHENILIMQTHVPQAGLLVLQFLDMFGKFTYQPLSKIASTTRNFAKEEFCKCNDPFSILEGILRGSGKFKFLIFRTCCGKSYISTEKGMKPISSEEMQQFNTLFTEMNSTKDAINDLLTKSIRMDERGKNDPGFNGIMTDQEFLKELHELKYQYRKIETQVQELKDKFCRKMISPVKQNRHSSLERPLQGEASQAITSRADISTPNTEQLRNDDNHAVNHSYSLLALLRCISELLSLADWVKLRRIITYHVPERALENIQNGVKVFEELVNRNFISHENLEFLRGTFYEIRRVDLVHLVDCIKEGDYSLLNEKKIQEPRNSTETEENTSINNGPHEQMQNLSLQANQDVVNIQAMRGDQPVTIATNETSATPRDDVVLQLKYQESPRRSQVSPSYPIQENFTHVIVGDSNEGAVNGGNNTATTRAEASASHEPTTSDSDSRHVGQAMGASRNTSTRDQDSGGKTTWDKTPGFPCDHYERHCEVQFSCCEKFWPCHRCHNSQSSCETRKLRSRDIKNVKCLRCGKVQQFPKETAHCVECNLKFSEYFCAICQHLTGTQSHPYHCEKCGICRVHGNRSFHCDICGVCLDVNLRNDHKCRAGSAHDECSICFEDAFTGCQILPCSHKVHKECASLMIQNGITKCPICRESFEHKIERRAIP